MKTSGIGLIEFMADEEMIDTIEIVEMFPDVYYFDFKTNQKKLSRIFELLSLESIREWEKRPDARMNETQVYQRLDAMKYKGTIEWIRLDY